MIRVWAALSICAAPLLSIAAEVRYNWTGTTTNVSDAHHILDGSVAIGGAIQGYISFESTTLDSNSSPDQGDYSQRLPQAIEFRLGNYIIRCASSTESYVLTMIDNGRDGDVIRAQGDSLISGPISNPAPGIGRLTLSDATGTAFSGDHLPTTVPLLTQYGTKLIYLVVRNTTGYTAVIVGQLTSLTDAGSGSSVHGNVNLQDFVGNLASQIVTVEVREPGHSEPLETHSVWLAANGDFSFDTSTLGWVDITVKGANWLRKKKSFVFIPNSGLFNQNFNLTNGDVDSDNEVTLSDYSILAAAFPSAAGDSNWNPYADLNGDEEINLADYSTLSRNFGQTGDD